MTSRTNLGTVSVGGAFYFGQVNTVGGASTIDSDDNEFKYFFNTGEGSAFYLPQNMELDDDNSNYAQNGGTKGGALYCDSCSFNMFNVNLQDFIALDGGMFYLVDDFTGVID